MLGTWPQTSGRRSCPPAVTAATSTSPVWMPARACRSLMPSSGGSSPTQPHDVLDDGQARFEGIAARGFLGLGVAEIGNGPVTLELGDHPAVRRDDRRHAVLIGVEDVVPVLGIEGGRQLGRANEVGEHHRQLPPLGRCRRSSSRSGPQSPSEEGLRLDPTLVARVKSRSAQTGAADGPPRRRPGVHRRPNDTVRALTVPCRAAAGDRRLCPHASRGFQAGRGDPGRVRCATPLCSASSSEPVRRRRTPPRRRCRPRRRRLRPPRRRCRPTTTTAPTTTTTLPATTTTHARPTDDHIAADDHDDDGRDKRRRARRPGAGSSWPWSSPWRRFSWRSLIARNRRQAPCGRLAAHGAAGRDGRRAGSRARDLTDADGRPATPGRRQRAGRRGGCGLERAAASAPDEARRALCSRCAESLRGLAFAVEADHLLRSGGGHPTGDQLAAADAARRSRSAELDVALRDLKAAITPTQGAG